MAALVQVRSGERIRLGARCILGRRLGCDVRIDDPRVSAEHAALHWTGERWELRDLGSKNGTLVRGKRLPPGLRVALARGTVFEIGSPDHAFSLEDASPPAARARHASGRVCESDSGPLVLPGEDDPEVSVFQDARGVWIAETPDATLEVTDGTVITARGEPWTLDLPAPFPATVNAGAAGPTLESISLRLAVSRDEEHVDVTVLHEGRETKLPARNHHYLLVVLARARLRDHASPPGERGWIDREPLCRMLAVDTNRLGVEIFRTRKQLGELGVQGAADIIVRRPASGQIRLGTDRVEIVSL